MDAYLRKGALTRKYDKKQSLLLTYMRLCYFYHYKWLHPFSNVISLPLVAFCLKPCKSKCSLRSADVFPVVASLPPKINFRSPIRRERSDDRKYVCASQAKVSAPSQKFVNTRDKTLSNFSSFQCCSILPKGNTWN